MLSEAVAEPASKGHAKRIERYGKRFPAGIDEATTEFYAFAHHAPLGRFQHCRRAIDLFWNAPFPGTFIWNDFSELLLETFCERDWVTITGAGATWKTTSVAMYVLARFFSSPKDTVIICTSTTLPGLRRRIWKEISRFWRLRPAYGNLVASRDCIQFVKGQDDAGIYGIATESGEINKALGKIIGFHSPNMIVVVDEMPYTPEAIVEACVNLQSGSQRFQFIGLGNADDRLDPHGRMCEPRGGWDSISVEHESWETKRGICIHLDGLKSPNVKAGKTIYPGMITQQDIDFTAANEGLDSPQFWQMRRGFWAPEGTQRTVLSMPMIVKARAREEASFDVGFTEGAALDPAFEGGDRCVLRFGKCGWSDGKKRLYLGEKVFIQTRVSPDDPIHYQIVRQVKEECIKRGVSPQFFALDSTGEGGGLASIFQREWSRDILCVEFGGRPSKRPLSQTNSKRADQEYDRRVTELWFGFRVLLQAEQIRGLDEETATEFCRRWYDMKGSYLALETKSKMKERTRKSPDLADAAVILTELFMQRDHLLPSKNDYPTAKNDSPWKRFLLQRSLQPDYSLVET
jgi:hypothetical protein